MPLPADLPQWAYGYALLFVLVHAVVLYYLYRATGTSTVAASTDAEDDVAADDRTVTCGNCGAENELGYRYCRNCVAELSGAVGRTSAEDAPNGRGIL